MLPILSPRFRPVVLAVLALVTASVFPACQSPAVREALARREAEIAAEPMGDYYVGRRYYTEKTRFWGYVRRPRQPWEKSQLVIMNERVSRVPDRLPEESPDGGREFGYDHNREYRIRGRFSGEPAYDPNSNLVLPEFVPSSFDLIKESGGWLFHPEESYSPFRLPPRP